MYSPTIFKYVLCVILLIVPLSEAFESNTSSKHLKVSSLGYFQIYEFLVKKTFCLFFRPISGWLVNTTPGGLTLFNTSAVLALSIEIADICRLFYLNADYFFKLSIKIVDNFLPGNEEISVLNLPGSGIPLNSGIKLNNRTMCQGWKTRLSLFITVCYYARSSMKDDKC